MRSQQIWVGRPLCRQDTKDAAHTGLHTARSRNAQERPRHVLITARSAHTHAVILQRSDFSFSFLFLDFLIPDESFSTSVLQSNGIRTLFGVCVRPCSASPPRFARVASLLLWNIMPGQKHANALYGRLLRCPSQKHLNIGKVPCFLVVA